MSEVIYMLQSEVKKQTKDLDVVAEYEFSDALISSLKDYIKDLELSKTVLLREGV